MRGEQSTTPDERKVGEGAREMGYSKVVDESSKVSRLWL